MQEILHATTTSPPPVTSYGDRAGMPRCESAWRKSRDDTGPMQRTDCRVGVPLLSGIIKSLLLMMMLVLMVSAVSHAQQIAMMTYELSIECVNVPGSSVTIAAAAEGDLFGSTYTWVDPAIPGNAQYFTSTQGSALSGGVNVTGLLWDFTDDNTPNAGRLVYGLYKFTGPDESFFYIDYRHCHLASPDVRIQLRYSGGIYTYAWRDYSIGQWVNITSDVLHLTEITGETRDVSCFQVDVTLQNVYHLAGGGATNQYGEIFVDDLSTSYPSPSTVAFSLESEHQSWPGSNLTDAVEQGQIHKMHDWNDNKEHHNIVLDWFTEVGTTVTANHHPTSSSRGTVLFDGVASTVDVQLRDPWKVNWPLNDYPNSDLAFNTYSFPALGFDFGSFSQFGGVFLNEAPDASSHSYFSIRVPEQLSWNGGGWEFLPPTADPTPGDARHWRNISAPTAFDILFTSPVNPSHVVADHVTQDVKFVAPDAALHVDYKMHFISGETVSYGEARGPLGANSQRKIGYLSSDGYVIIYESDGHVWLTHSAATPLTWTWESCLGSGKHPSLYAVEDSVFVTWIDNDRVVAGKYHNGQFQEFESPSLASFHPSGDAFPVIAVAEDLDVIVFESDVSPNLSYIVLECDEFITEGHIPPLSGSGLSCVTPTITASTGPHFDIAWREGPDIEFTHMTMHTWTQPIQAYFLHGQLLPRYKEEYVGAPSITNYHYTGSPPNDIIRIISAPSREAPGQAKINIFSMDATMVWANMQSFYSGYHSRDIWAPSLSSLDVMPCTGAYDNIRCAFNVTDYTMYPTAYYTRAVGVNCGTWNITDPQISQAIHPSLVAFPPAMRGQGVHIDLQSAHVPNPLTVNCKELGTTDLALNKATARVDLRSSRVVWLRSDTSVFGIGLGGVELIGNSVDRTLDWDAATGPDPINTASAVSRHLLTEPFTAGSGMVLKYRMMRDRGNGQIIPNGVNLHLELIDAGTSTVVATLESIDATTLQSGRTIITTTSNLGPYCGQNLRLRLRPDVTAPSVSFAIADYHNIDTTAGNVFPKADVEYSIEGVEASISGMRLDQNYPNPFNPSTTLTWFVPEVMHALLIVYDAMGREVCRLVDAEVMAGEHRTEFSAEGLASGVYYAKLIAGDLVVTRRMTLLR